MHLTSICHVILILVSFGLNFASRKVVTDFLIATLMIVVVPLILVGGGNYYFKDAVGMSEL